MVSRLFIIIVALMSKPNGSFKITPCSCTSKMSVGEKEVKLKQFVSLLKFKIRLAAGRLYAH